MAPEIVDRLLSNAVGDLGIHPAKDYVDAGGAEG